MPEVNDDELVEQSGSAIPPHAKRVFKGIIFEVWQWEQKLFDGTTTTFEKLRRPDTVEVLAVTKEGKIIIEEQEQPARKHHFFSLPGGRADGGESLEAEIKRELLEETGYASDDWELLKTIQPFYDNDYRVHLFIARGAEQLHQSHLDAGEKITLRFLTFDELLAFADEPYLRSGELAKILLRLRLHPEEQADFRKRLLD